MSLLALGTALLLSAAANGAPIAAKKALGARGAWPLDGDAAWFDGRPVFGPSKTVRGLLASFAAAALLAPALGLDAETGVETAAAAMAGDLLSSFVKRRLGRPSSSLGAGEVGLGVVVFFLGELVVSRLLYRAHLRDQPY
jgi:CDP-diglyceride synthetase